MSVSTIALSKEIAGLSATLAALLDEHTKDNFGEVLPHVFFGEVSRYAIALLQKSQSDNDLAVRRELRSILDTLEAAMAKRVPDVQELIAASFLENLPSKGGPGSELRGMLGPTLSSQMRKMT